ncbi:MAG TPA: bis-aminopropyl spermidine synthase family protein, partial [Mycobacteriales bacterium]|nr:bis-aminopropyl spermidine synthase family protein [Mycobacteriales bacterium]
LVSVALAAFAERHGRGAAPASLTVVELDPELVAFLRSALAGAPFPVEVVEHDLRSPLPELGRFDTVQTDPPYTVDGATLFLERAAAVVRPGADVFLSFGVRRPDETVLLQRALSRLGLAVRLMVPGFNEYVGAGVLGGTSALWQLVMAAPAGGPVAADSADGTVYTGHGRNRRRYACIACATGQTVGEGRRWRTVAELKEAGCPRCGGHTFKPRKGAR